MSEDTKNVSGRNDPPSRVWLRRVGRKWVSPDDLPRPGDHVYIRSDIQAALAGYALVDPRKEEAVKKVVEALTCDGNNPRFYTLLDWCADRLHIIADGDTDRLGSVESQREIVAMLRSKGAIARDAIKEFDALEGV